MSMGPKQSTLHGFLNANGKRPADATPGQGAGPSNAAGHGTSPPPPAPVVDAIADLKAGRKLGSMDPTRAAALAEYVAARSTHKISILPMDTIKLSDAAAAGQPIVSAGLFPSQLQILRLPYAGGLLDADGCVTITESYGRISATVMYGQSNLAGLSMLAHTFASHGIPITHATLHRVDDMATGRYVHGDKVHLLLYRQGGAAQLAALLVPYSGMKQRQLQLLVSQWPLVGSMGLPARRALAASCRQLNADAHQEANLNKDVLRDEQGRPNWGYLAGIYDGDGTVTFQIDKSRTKLVIALAQPKSPAWLRAIHEVFQIGTVQAGGASQNASLQIRERAQLTTFLRYYVPEGQLKVQKLLTLITKEFGVSLQALVNLIALPDHRPTPPPLGRGLAGAYSTKERKSTRPEEERLRLKEKDHFLASQWVTLLADEGHRASWSH